MSTTTSTTSTTEDFTGFPEEGLAFLEELGGADKAWFDANRKTYEASVVGPTKAFVTAIGERLADGIAPDITAQPKTNGSISPINNDLRFSPDKTPYKDHMLLRFWEGPTRKTSPTLFLFVSGDRIGYASGAMLTDIDRWRELIDDERTGGELADALATLAKGRDLELDGQGYKRVPKPYDEDHPRADLLRHKGGIQARWIEPAPKSITSARFADHCMKRLEACADVHRWFVTNL